VEGSEPFCRTALRSVPRSDIQMVIETLIVVFVLFIRVSSSTSTCFGYVKILLNVKIT